MKFSKLYTFLLALVLVFPSVSKAQHEHAVDSVHSEQEITLHNEAHEEHSHKFDPGQMIMHHISDAHEIHFFTLNEGTESEKHFSIYLPVILKSKNGWEFFSSSPFYHSQNPIQIKGKTEHYSTHGDYVMFHEHIYYKGDTADLMLDEKGVVINDAPLDMSLTKSVVGIFIAFFILFLLLRSAAKGYEVRKGKAPKGVQSLLEPFIIFIRDDVAKPALGRHTNKFLPFLLSAFFFIWVCNIMGLVPFIGGFNITGTLGVTIVLATFVFILTTVNGNGNYWGHIFWPPGVPFLIKIILIPIELFGIFIKPFVLMVRLTANITAGHIIMLSFLSLIFIFGQSSAVAGYGVGIGATAFMVFMFFIELLVAFLQAYVFTLLAALYFGSAVEEAHH